MEPQKLEALAPKGSLVEDYWDAQRAAMTHLDTDVHLRSLVLYIHCACDKTGSPLFVHCQALQKHHCIMFVFVGILLCLVISSLFTDGHFLSG